MKEIVMYVIIATLPNEKTGLINLNGEIIIPFEYSQLSFLNNEFFKAQNSTGLWGIIDINNSIVIPFEYEDLGYQMSFNLLPAQKNKKWGLINRVGINILPYTYDKIYGFDKRGQAINIKDKLYGIIDNNCNEVVPNIYKWLNYLGGITIYVDENRINGCLDSDNKTIFTLPKGYIFPPGFKYLDKSIILKETENETLLGLIDSQGEILLEPKYNSGLFVKEKNGNEYIHGVNNFFKKGNSSFELYINGKIQNFNGIIRFIDHNYGVNKDRVVISIEKEGQIKFGVIDPEGLIVVPFEYEDLRYLRDFKSDKINENNLIFAKKGGGYGIINENEKIYFNFEYPKLRYMNHGYYRNDTQEGTLLYNKEGKLIFKNEEIWLWFQIEEHPGLFYARNNQNMYGIVDVNGKWIFQPIFKNLGFVREFRKL